MERYEVNQFDGSTYQVVDLQEAREICVCSEFDAKEDAKTRAELITALLNNKESQCPGKPR